MKTPPNETEKLAFSLYVDHIREIGLAPRAGGGFLDTSRRTAPYVQARSALIWGMRTVCGLMPQMISNLFAIQHQDMSRQGILYMLRAACSDVNTMTPAGMAYIWAALKFVEMNTDQMTEASAELVNAGMMSPPRMILAWGNVDLDRNVDHDDFVYDSMTKACGIRAGVNLSSSREIDAITARFCLTHASALRKARSKWQPTRSFEAPCGPVLIHGRL